MLKRAADSSKEPIRAVALESWVAALSSAAAGSPCEATFTAKGLLPALGFRWSFASEQSRFALTLEGGQDDKFGKKELAGIRLAAYLAGIRAEARLDLRSCGPEKESRSWNYLIRSATGQRLLATYEEDLNADYLPPVERVYLGKKRAARLVLRMTAKDIRGSGHVNFSDAKFFLSDPAGELKLSLMVQEDGSEGIRFCVVEDKMDAGTVNDKCRATLNLGRIEMNIEEVLALRPGMIIAFERPSHFPVTLEVMGAPVAHGTMTIQDQTLSLVIDDLERAENCS